jgi:hypothetical protein
MRPITSITVLSVLGIQALAAGARATADPTGTALDSGMNVAHWQLFIDGFAIARATGFDRVVHHPKPRGVVIPADKPWETCDASPGFVGRCKDGRFVAIYGCRWWIPDPEGKQQPDRAQQYTGASAYAVSTDGIHWEKPILGLVEAPAGIDWNVLPPLPAPKGFSKENNLGVPFALYDLGLYGNVSDPAKRYLVKCDGRMHFASDIPDFVKDTNWKEKLVPCDGQESRRNAVSFWDNLHGEWVGISQGVTGHWIPSRDVARFCSKDMKTWTSDSVLFPDPADSHTPQCYDEPMSMQPFCAEGVLFGLLSWFHSDRTDPDGGPVWEKTAGRPYIWPWARKGPNEMRITISRDGGKSWDRTSSREAWIPHGTEEDSYDRMVIGITPPVYVSDEDWFYASVWDGDHLTTRANAKQNTYYHDRVRKGQIALYTQKHNRYVSLRARMQRETLITKPFTVEGDALQLNVDATRGEVKCAIAAYEPAPSLGGTVLTMAAYVLEGRALPGFGYDDCEPILANSTEHAVKFKGGSLSSLKGRRVVLFVRMVDADLYGFRVR